jgi:TonB family protein
MRITFMRIPAIRRIKAIRIVILGAGILGCLASGVATPCRAAGMNGNEFFRAFSEAETVAERRDLCSRLDPSSAPAYMVIFCQAYDALAAGRDSLAVDFLRASLREEPRFALGYVAFGDAYMEMKKWEPALRWYHEARVSAPERLDPCYGIGRIWLERAATEGAPAYEKALDAFREMTAISPKSPDGWSDVGMVLGMLGRYDEGEASYRKALDLSPQDPQIYFSLGSLQSRRGDDAGAEASWLHALKIQPSLADAAVELASLYGRQGRIGKATTTLEAAYEAAHVGPEAGRVRRDLGLLRLAEGQTSLADSLLAEAKILDGDAVTLAALGHIRMMQGQPADALPLFAESAVLDSAVVRPFARAWSEEITASLATAQGVDPAGAGRLKAILAGAGESVPSKGSATPNLVQGVLADWKFGGTGVVEEKSDTGYDTPAVPVYKAPVSYPEEANGAGGTILIRLKVDAEGSVRDARIVKGGDAALERAALDAAKLWRFNPALRNGAPVASEFTIPFHFAVSE